jgi:hypothetical protein
LPPIGIGLGVANTAPRVITTAALCLALAHTPMI